jgi:alpha-glucosidase
VPLPWDETSSSSGFSETDKSWLPQPENYGLLARSLQEQDESSTLAFYRKALAVRKQLALGEGSFDWVPGHTGPDSLGYENSGIRVIYNFGQDLIDLGSAEILISSAPIVGGQLETNSCVWVRAR